MIPKRILDSITWAPLPHEPADVVIRSSDPHVELDIVACRALGCRVSPEELQWETTLDSLAHGDVISHLANVQYLLHHCYRLECDLPVTPEGAAGIVTVGDFVEHVRKTVTAVEGWAESLGSVRLSDSLARRFLPEWFDGHAPVHPVPEIRTIAPTLCPACGRG